MPTPKQKKRGKRTNYKLCTLKEFPEAYCVRLADGSGYIVWPRENVGDRCAEMCAIGVGRNADKAWQDAFGTIRTYRALERVQQPPRRP